MSYEVVDEVLIPWTKKGGYRLSTWFGGNPARFFYVSAGTAESYQVAIEPPEGDELVINAWSIETVGDEEFHRSWRTTIDGLTNVLDDALTQIDAWSKRAL